MIDPELLEADDAVTPRQLRQFAALWLAFGAVLATRAIAADHLAVAGVIAVAALVGGLAGLARPETVRPLFVGLVALTRPIGVAVSAVLLALFFACVIVPVGLLFRWRGRDVLTLRPTLAHSYWQPHPPRPEAARYFRQY